MKVYADEDRSNSFCENYSVAKSNILSTESLVKLCLRVIDRTKKKNKVLLWLFNYLPKHFLFICLIITFAWHLNYSLKKQKKNS